MFYVAPALTSLTWPFAEKLLIDAYGYGVEEVGIWAHTAAVFVTSFLVLKMILRGAVVLIMTASGKYGWDFLNGGLSLPF